MEAPTQARKATNRKYDVMEDEQRECEERFMRIKEARDEDIIATRAYHDIANQRINNMRHQNEQERH